MRHLLRILFFAFPASLPWFASGQSTWPLDSCLQYAYSRNLGLRMSALSLDNTELDRKAAIGGLLPSLNAQGSHGYNWGQRIDPFTNQFATERIQSNSLGISTSVNLFSGFQQVNQVRQSELNIERGRWDYEKSRNDLALNIASAYLTVLLNREIAEIAEFNVANTRTQVERISRLVNAGQLAQGNLDQINSQLASDQSTLVSAQNNQRLARLNLMQLMQLEPQFQDEFDIVIPDLGEVSGQDILANPDVAVQAALANFPEVKSAQTNLASAEIGESIARGGRYPRLTASYSYGTGYSGASRLLTGSADSLAVPIGTVIGSNDVVLSFPQPIYSDEDYTVKPFGDQLNDNVNKSLFFNLTIPLFNGFSTDVSVKKAAINRLNAELMVEQTRQQLQQSVERAYADAQAALASYEASRISREASERAFAWAQTRYEQGLTNQAEYADARNKLDIASATEVRMKYDYVFKVKILEFYQGKPITLK